MKIFSFTALLCSLLVPGGLPAGDLRPFDRMDVFELEWVSNPQNSGGSFSVSSNNRIAFSYGTPYRPSELAIVDGRGDRIRNRARKGDYFWPPLLRLEHKKGSAPDGRIHKL